MLRSIQQVAQLAVSVVARVEVRRLLGDDGTDLAQVRPSRLIGGIIHRATCQVEEGTIAVQFLRPLALRRDLPFDLREYLGIDEAVAGRDERPRCLLFAKAVDALARFLQA